MTALTAPGRATGPRFVLPPDSAATLPPEERGLERDGVRLLVASPDDLRHRQFRDLAGALEPGDLVVVNTSATLPAALDAHLPDGRVLPLHVAGPGAAADGAGPGEWIVELRSAANDGPEPTAAHGLRLRLPRRVGLTLRSPYPRGAGSRLWTAAVEPQVALQPYLAAHGRPVTYRYLAGRPPLSAYQNVYADVPGSAEMASAGRPFTADLLVRLLARGIAIAPVVLHTGLSSPELHEPPAPERYCVPAATARLVNVTRASGRRVVAVGTTVVRALETVAGVDGTVRPGRGWTGLVLGPDRPARAVTGLITGLHEPEASHVLLLDAVAGPELVDAAYAEVVAERYRWHEFGDSTVFLPAL